MSGRQKRNQVSTTQRRTTRFIAIIFGPFPFIRPCFYVYFKNMRNHSNLAQLRLFSFSCLSFHNRSALRIHYATCRRLCSIFVEIFSVEWLAFCCRCLFSYRPVSSNPFSCSAGLHSADSVDGTHRTTPAASARPRVLQADE